MDIKNNFGETDYQIDIFAEIEKAYDGGVSIFDNISKDGLIMAFSPCIYFCDAKVLCFKGVSNFFSNKTLHEIMDWNIEAAKEREVFYYAVEISKNSFRKRLKNGN